MWRADLGESDDRRLRLDAWLTGVVASGVRPGLGKAGHARRGRLITTCLACVIAVAIVAMPGLAQARTSVVPLKQITVGAAPMDVAIARAKHGAALAYVSNFDSDTVSVIDTRRHEVVDTITVGQSPSPVVASRDGRLIYVGTDAYIAVIDAQEQRVVRHIGGADGSFALAVSPDGRVLYADSGGSGPLTVFDTRTGSVINRIQPSNGHAGALEASPDGRRLYVGIFDKPFWVDVFDTASLGELAAISVPLNPLGLSLSPDGRQLYVANWGDFSNIIPIAGHSVQVFDTRTRDLLGVVPTGDYPSSIGFTPDGRYALVVNNSEPGSVTVVRRRDRQVVETVAVGVCPTDVAVTPTGREAYVTNTGVGAICSVSENTVSVLSIQKGE
jgi:YVTN family beta-propeller protein